MKAIKNMRELRLMKQQLQYQERLYEKEMTESTADIIDNLSDKLRDMAFDIGARLILRFIHGKRRRHTADD